MNSTFADIDNNTLLNQSDISVSESDIDIENDDNVPRKKLKTFSDVDDSQTGDEEGSSGSPGIT